MRTEKENKINKQHGKFLTRRCEAKRVLSLETTREPEHHASKPSTVDKEIKRGGKGISGQARFSVDPTVMHIRFEKDRIVLLQEERAMILSEEMQQN